MTDDISLLPTDLRGREGEEKKKAKEASVKPRYKMHLPDEDRAAEARADSSSEKNPEIPDIEIGVTPPFANSGETGAFKKENQGVFKISTKTPGAVEKDGSGRDIILEEAGENKRASEPEVNLMMKKFSESKKHHALFKAMIVVVGGVLILTIGLIASFYFPRFIK